MRRVCSLVLCMQPAFSSWEPSRILSVSQVFRGHSDLECPQTEAQSSEVTARGHQSGGGRIGTQAAWLGSHAFNPQGHPLSQGQAAGDKDMGANRTRGVSLISSTVGSFHLGACVFQFWGVVQKYFLLQIFCPLFPLLFVFGSRWLL